MKTKRVTLKTIASRAGVSTVTVSRALNSRYDVSEETRRKILAIAKELGYTPNHLAKSLKSGRTKTVGVIVSDISNPFFGTAIRGMVEALRKKKCHILLCDSSEDPSLEEESFQVLLERRVDGIIVTTSSEENLRKFLPIFAQENIPCVLLARRIKGISISFVTVDDVFGSFAAVEHLIRKGHKRILYMAGPFDLTTSKDRLQGYTEALKKYGIERDDNLIHFTKAKMEDGYAVVKEALRKGFEFTAIATFNDYLAFGALRALLEEDLKVPDDVSIVGYDDVEFAAISWVPLTTVRIPKYELGVEAAKILLSHIRKEVEEIQEVVLKPELIVRNST